MTTKNTKQAVAALKKLNSKELDDVVSLLPETIVQYIASLKK